MKQDMGSAIVAWLERQPGWFVPAASLLLALLVGWVDYITGFEISLSFFYLIPIALVTWFHGERNGLWTALLCAGLWLGANALTGSYSNGLIMVWNVAVRFAIFLSITILLARLHDHLESESGLARTDYLTGAVNSRAFYEVMEEELQRSRRYRHPFAVGYLDMDNFKEINDTFGHSAGDAILRQMAGIIRGNIRSVDVLARLGGDEFIILLPETNDSAQATFQRLHGLLTGELGRTQGSPTLSMGSISFLSPPASVDEVIRLADEVMYRAKKNGKNALGFETYLEKETAKG